MLEHNSAGFRCVPGTALKRSDGKIVYNPKMLGLCLTDRNYSMVANDLLAILESEKEMVPPGVNIRDMAIRLALYLKDVVSDGLTWGSFTYLCRKLY